MANSLEQRAYPERWRGFLALDNGEEAIIDFDWLHDATSFLDKIRFGGHARVKDRTTDNVIWSRGKTR
jgi:hypothetical protein